MAREVDYLLLITYVLYLNIQGLKIFKNMKKTLNRIYFHYLYFLIKLMMLRNAYKEETEKTNFPIPSIKAWQRIDFGSRRSIYSVY